MIDLNKHIEEISDDFQSTFTLVNESTLANMLGPDDIKPLTDIILKYYQNIDISFKKTNELGDDPYDIYLIIITEKP